MLKSTMLANEALFYYYRSNCMSRLENHAMLRDAAMFLIYSMLSWRNMAWPQSRESFRGN